MNKRLITIVGHFDWQGNNMIGAVIKARNIYYELIKRYSADSVGDIDIYGWKEKKFRILINIIYAFTVSRNIVLVCSNTSIILSKIIEILKRMTKCKVHYCVVGADMPDLLSENKYQIQHLKSIDMFYVETRTCMNRFKELGLVNVKLLLNFKDIEPIDKKNIFLWNDQIYRFCTLSRVTREKGISDAINAICSINKENGTVLCSLDVYGPIDDGYSEEFNNLVDSNKEINYCGIIDSKITVSTICQYYCLIFPTRYTTEGIPGTIIDSFASGKPVICSCWPSCKEIVVDGYNGFIYKFRNSEALKETIEYTIKNRSTVYKASVNALESFKRFQSNTAIISLLEEIRE